MRGWIRKSLTFIVGTIIGHYLWPISEKLGEEATIEWVNHQIAERYGIVSPSQEAVIEFVISWAVPAGVAIAILIIFWIGMVAEKRRASKIEEPQESPLEIVFDATNPARRFWSLESPRDEKGSKLPGVFHEYRVEVWNNSPKTIRNVSVTVEHLGQLPVRPVNATFDKIRKTVCDINPRCSELVPVIRWPHPKVQAGMISGPAALEYGPVKIVASADDVLPATRIFQFDYQSEPMLFDSIVSRPMQADLKAIDGFKIVIATGRRPGRSPEDVSREIHDLLHQDKLIAWGRRGSDLPQGRIPATEWENIEIDFGTRALEATTPDGFTSQACAWTRDIKSKRRLRYVDVQFSEFQFYRLFSGVIGPKYPPV